MSFFDKVNRIKFTLGYMAMIPFINVLLPRMPMIDFGGGTKFTPVSLLVGFIYILRDFSQNEIGRKNIFFAMAMAGMLTYLLAHPAQAAASLIAFLCGELTDWLVYSTMKRPLSQRVLVSNLISIPVDIIVVLMGLQFAMPGFLALNPFNFMIMYASNMASAVLVFYVLRHKEKRAT